ncbi:MAG TPA: sporulation transcriptional regulator SpoIIID [Candidatus Caccopulliclostridium gallistercoris]|uniref:Sporulation transcriptional regulator SpoIIID n=1 Tax=Candidatus Caccopulliclostridium gallistercoris TaxID=2840719 RepID=A0A9D1SYP4_9FIRM|nr:sporulation transcriptional regulator SpoIIID [Candidatus Caccopulliclostridium gallistercoris]
MKVDISERAVTFARHILDSGDTVRQTAFIFGISKSTVHYDVSHRLKKIDFNLYKKVNKILEKNFNEKHIRGGNSTKNKYLKMKKK